MTISYNTGAANSATTATSVGLAIPAGVLVGDVMLMSLEVFTETSSAPTIGFSGAGGSWTQIGSTQLATSGTSLWSYGFAFYRVASPGDPGAALTISESGSPLGTTWLATAMAAYTGADTSSPIDVSAGANVQGAQTIACPSKLTGKANDWAVYMAAVGLPNGVMTGPSGSTQRQQLVSGANIGAAIYDSNGSVGAAGTSIGGGLFTAASTATWLEAFTIGLALPVSGASLPDEELYGSVAVKDHAGSLAIKDHAGSLSALVRNGSWQVG